MNKFFTFDEMITPLIIKIAYWIGMICTALFGFIMVIHGLTGYGAGGVQVLMGLIWMVLGPILVRVYCELLILMFRVYDILVEIRNKLASTSAPVPPRAT